MANTHGVSRSVSNLRFLMMSSCISTPVRKILLNSVETVHEYSLVVKLLAERNLERFRVATIPPPTGAFGSLGCGSDARYDRRHLELNHYANMRCRSATQNTKTTVQAEVCPQGSTVGRAGVAGALDPAATARCDHIMPTSVDDTRCEIGKEAGKGRLKFLPFLDPGLDGDDLALEPLVAVPSWILSAIEKGPAGRSIHHTGYRVVIVARSGQRRRPQFIRSPFSGI